MRRFNNEAERAWAILNERAQGMGGIEPSLYLLSIAREICDKEYERDEIEGSLDDLWAEADAECQQLVADKKREVASGACPECGYLTCTIPQHNKGEQSE